MRILRLSGEVIPLISKTSFVKVFRVVCIIVAQLNTFRINWCCRLNSGNTEEIMFERRELIEFETEKWGSESECYHVNINTYAPAC